MMRDGQPEAMIVFMGEAVFDMINRGAMAHIPVTKVRASPIDVLSYVWTKVRERVERRWVLRIGDWLARRFPRFWAQR